MFRLNIGITGATYRSLFGSESADTGEGDGLDYTVIDRLLPHPVYGRASWICVLNPSETTLQELRPLLTEAYDLAVSKHLKQKNSKQSNRPD